jgi:hypothetical protein
LGKGVDNGSDEQLNKAPAMNGNESTGKRTDAPFLVLSPPHDLNYIKFYRTGHVKNVKGRADHSLICADQSKPNERALVRNPDERACGQCKRGFHAACSISVPLCGLGSLSLRLRGRDRDGLLHWLCDKPLAAPTAPCVPWASYPARPHLTDGGIPTDTKASR